MGYRGMVVKMVDTAFQLIGDLAVDVQLSQSNPTGYNFSTKTLTNSTPTITNIKGVLETVDREDTENTLKMKLILKSKDISNPSIYDTAIINGILWTVVPPYEDNDYTITLYLTREA